MRGLSASRSMMSTTFLIGLITIVSVSLLKTTNRTVSTTQVKIVVTNCMVAYSVLAALTDRRAYATKNSHPLLFPFKQNSGEYVISYISSALQGQSSLMKKPEQESVWDQKAGRDELDLPVAGSMPGTDLTDRIRPC